MSQSGQVATLVFAVTRPAVGWELYEGTMPETELHSQAITLLEALLKYWARRWGARIVTRLPIRWVEEDARIGVDPDVAVLLPPPPVEEGALESVFTWLPGHEPPLLAIEVVSKSNAHKDYSIAPAKYAASGTQELWVFDPLLCGPKQVDGPYRLQIWRRNGSSFERIYAGTGPARSPALDAWVVATDDGRKLRVTSDAAATDFWLTEEEAAVAQKNAALAQKDAALARVAELEAELARRGG
ncbi:MAG: Uma2 family endonuclease [Labilithrix sp.]|nr:Uma2 family endonuclease [Labilithrix sp.]MCW5810511.1 Uma2 family endonuclease [Labilithrix sp.]